MSITRGYREAVALALDVPSSIFDSNFIVLCESEDSRQTFGLESTAQLAAALRNVIMRDSGVQPVPAWVSGHEPDGRRLESSSHLAIVPMAFVDNKYADGHLLGLAVLVPRSVTYGERAKMLSPVLFDKDNEPRKLRLTLAKVGEWNIEREGGFSPKASLRPLTYTQKNCLWASVTPVVLDRMPKSDRARSPIHWREEVAGIVAQSCRNVGLPQPLAVRVEKTPFFRGSLRAMPGQGGFPLLREGSYQGHVCIEFEQDVAGPVLIGAGRFRGYGLMRPWKCEVGQ